MTYSLFLGSGPAGQIEFFSLFCKKAVERGTSLDTAVKESYSKIKKISKKILSNGLNPFPGYGSSENSFDETFSRFHPFELYKEYSILAIPNIAFPIIAIDDISH